MKIIKLGQPTANSNPVKVRRPPWKVLRRLSLPAATGQTRPRPSSNCKCGRAMTAAEPEFRVLTGLLEGMEKREPLHCWWDCKLVQSL